MTGFEYRILDHKVQSRFNEDFIARGFPSAVTETHVVEDIRGAFVRDELHPIAGTPL
jgi:hypothetical protein